MGSAKRKIAGVIPAVAQTLIAQFSLGHIATVTPDGVPAVSPKGTFLVLDDTTLAFGNIRSPGTVTNLRANPACETGFVDPFTRKGVRIAGQARIVPDDSDEFAELLPKWQEVWGELADRISDIVVIDVTRSRPVSTPPYDDGATEDEMIAAYKAKYQGIYP